MIGRIGRTLLVLAVVVGVVIAILAAFQRQLIYFPGPTVPPAASALREVREVDLRTADGLELGAWFVPAGEPDTRMAVLVAPGNGGNRAGRVPLARELRGRGFSVLLMDYRGYGGNPGSPSEEGLAADADAAVAALADLGFPPERTIYLGESLGTGVVAALQARTPPAAVLLRSPFPELADVGARHYPFLPVRLLLRDRFEVLEHVRASEVPMTVVHGDRDSVIPPDLSRQVADAVPRLVEHVVLRGADHNDPVMFGEPVADAVARLARQVR